MPHSLCLTHYDNVISLQEEGKNVDVVYLDFSNTFDKVDQNILLIKMKLLGIDGKTLRWLQSFLSSRTQRVMVNGKLSGEHPVISGVPQGSEISVIPSAH